MAVVDSFCLEKLGEALYDEKKVVNYKTVSTMFRVHVNVAKQVLFQLYTRNKAQKKNVYATYYLSGMITRKMLSSLSPTADQDVNKLGVGADPEAESFLVALCKEKELDETKAKFSHLYSVHMYSLSAFPVENYDALQSLAEQPTVDSDGSTPVSYGPITCSDAEKLLTNGEKNIPIPNTTVTVKRDTIKPVSQLSKKEVAPTSSETKKEGLSTPVTNKETTETTRKQVKDPISDKSGGNRLKNMFATAATKPKKVDNGKSKVEIESKPEPKESSKNSSVTTNKPKADSTKSKKGNTDSNSKKRKRIREDILSSSESDDDGTKSDDDIESLPESPLPPRKRIQIDSDSDDDFKETACTKDNHPEIAEPTSSASGRKRVSKLISKTSMSSDGFLVTEKKHVMVSEDEDAEADSEENKSANNAKVSSASQSSAESKKPDSQPTKANSSKPLSGKTKQPSLMSFFQKK